MPSPREIQIDTEQDELDEDDARSSAYESAMVSAMDDGYDTVSRMRVVEQGRRRSGSVWVWFWVFSCELSSRR